MHSSGEPLDDDGLAALVASVRTSIARMTADSLNELVTALPEPITSLAVRGWPLGFPEDIATQRRPPYESRADSVVYCQVLSEVAAERGWSIHTYDAKTVESDAAAMVERPSDCACGNNRHGLTKGRPQPFHSCCCASLSCYTVRVEALAP